MKFISTRAKSPAVGLSDALRAGLAPDGGLYVPQVFPQLDARAFDGAESLAAVAERLLAPYFAGDALADELPAICRDALDLPVPVVTLDQRSQVLELFHGPTAAFKDFGARFLAACFARVRHADEAPITILVATSGDTGSAVAAAFHRRPGFRVAILYPEGRVSPHQAHQLGCFGDNVQAFRVAGSFDDCQRLVKQAFADTGLRERTPLASANSISLGRLLPQAAYYAHAALVHARRGGNPLGFVVPTGNLGNAFAAMMARAMGLPIGALHLATNANRTLSDYFASAHYEGRASVATMANAMDVGDPSNAERLRWLYPDIAALRVAVSADAVDDGTIAARIREGESRYGQVWCPHTACAVEVLERRRAAGDGAPLCIVATAHPAKFESVVEPLVGHAVPLPPALAAMLARPARDEAMPAEYSELKTRLATA